MLPKTQPGMILSSLAGEVGNLGVGGEVGGGFFARLVTESSPDEPKMRDLAWALISLMVLTGFLGLGVPEK